jgi:hypothetical protein
MGFLPVILMGAYRCTCTEYRVPSIEYLEYRVPSTILSLGIWKFGHRVCGCTLYACLMFVFKHVSVRPLLRPYACKSIHRTGFLFLPLVIIPPPATKLQVPYGLSLTTGGYRYSLTCETYHVIPSTVLLYLYCVLHWYSYPCVSYTVHGTCPQW